MRRLLAALGAAGIAAAAACAGGEDVASGAWRGTVDTLAGGVVHVRSPAEPMLDPAAGWRLVEELRIGSAGGDGPDVFSDVRDVDVDAAGRIHVLQSQARNAQVFGADRRFLRTIGRSGAGPGEFEQPNGLAVDPQGRLWVADPRNVRFTAFDTTGTVVASHRREIGSHGFQWSGTFLHDGRLVETDVHYSHAGRDGSAVVRFDDTFAPRDTLLRALDPPESEAGVFVFRQGPRTSYVQVPFHPSARVTVVDPRGLLWTGDQGAYRLVARTLDGDTVRVVERRYEPVPVADADLADFREMVERLGTPDESRIPAAKPAFSTFTVAPDGHLWVRLHRPHGEVGTVFDVFDPDGRFVAQVRAPVDLAPYPVITITADALHGVVRDELDVPQVVRLRLVRGDAR